MTQSIHILDEQSYRKKIVRLADIVLLVNKKIDESERIDFKTLLSEESSLEKLIEVQDAA